MMIIRVMPEAQVRSVIAATLSWEDPNFASLGRRSSHHIMYIDLMMNHDRYPPFSSRPTRDRLSETPSDGSDLAFLVVALTLDPGPRRSCSHP